VSSANAARTSPRRNDPGHRAVGVGHEGAYQSPRPLMMARASKIPPSGATAVGAFALTWSSSTSVTRRSRCTSGGWRRVSIDHAAHSTEASRKRAGCRSYAVLQRGGNTRVRKGRSPEVMLFAVNVTSASIPWTRSTCKCRIWKEPAGIAGSLWGGWN
jgi:hypothetical protein